jgi:hypothetical protein
VWSWAWAAPVLLIGESPVAIGALPTAFALPIAIAWEGSRVRGRSGVSTAGTARPGLALDTADPSA